MSVAWITFDVGGRESCVISPRFLILTLCELRPGGGGKGRKEGGAFALNDLLPLRPPCL